MKGIKVINTLNSDINRSNKDVTNNDKYKNIYKRDCNRRNSITEKNNETTNKKENNELNNKKIMSKEQRNLLRNILKENVKENKKAIAKNLIGIFLESNKNNRKSKFKIKNNSNIITEDKQTIQTPKNKLYKKAEKSEKNASNSSLKKIKRYASVVGVRPSNFSKEYQKQKQKEEAKNKGNSLENKKESNIVIHENEENDEDNNDINIISEGFANNEDFNNNNDKINFTSLFKLHQEISEIQTNPKFSTPRGPIIIPQIEKKIEVEDKKGIIFQSKSFRDFVENNNRKNYDECLKFINTTHIISHLDDSDKLLLIQSLKIKKFNKDDCILNSHEKCSVIYFVKNGLLQCVDDDGTCIKTLISGENFGEKELLIDINIDFNLITKSNCACYIIKARTLKKMFGPKFRDYIFYYFMKAAFDCSKLFQTMNSLYIYQIYKIFSLVNLNKDNVAFPIGHIKNSKFVIIVDGYLKNSKNDQIVGRPLDILFEEELLSLSDEKTKYALYPSPDALFFEGDTNEILKHLQSNSFEDVLNKNIIFENLSKIILFKSFSQLKLFKLIDLIHIEKYKKGEKIIKEGTKGEKFYIVKAGQVESLIHILKIG